MINYTYNIHTPPQLYTAAQMWCLGRLLPVMIGDMIPVDEHWQNFLDMMTIVDYVFAPAVTPDIAEFLHDKIRDHHDRFCRLYPVSSFIPKLHYMLHIPEWILKWVLVKGDRQKVVYPTVARLL